MGNKSYIILICTSFLLMISCNNKKSERTPASKPNVLFIISDDMNDAISVLGGHPQTKTPNLDRLAEKGVCFTNAHSNNPICAPSRASLTTSLYPHTSGYFGGNPYNFRDNPVLKDAKTFIEHFKDNGYKVYGTGKILHHSHRDASIWVNKDGEYGYGIPPSFGPYPWDGKDESVTGHNVPHPQLPDELFINSRPGNYADVTVTPLSNVPEYKPDPANEIPGYKGWRLYKKPFHYENENDRDLMPDELSAQWVIDKLREDHQTPFLMCVGFMRPHVPHIAPKKYFDRFPMESLQIANILPEDTADCAKILVRDFNYGAGNLDGIENFQATISAGGFEMGLKRWTQAYLACINFVDDQLGKIMDALNNSRYAENTIIVFTSDHGYHMGEKTWLYKNSLWEESTRIPMIWSGPGIATNIKSNHPTSLIDIYPTLNDLCGLPANPNMQTNNRELDGYSLKPLLVTNNPSESKGPGFALTYVASKTGSVRSAGDISKPEDHHATIRDDRFRYILCINGEEELYDHQNDPYEWYNLADSVDFKDIKESMKEKLISFTRKSEVIN